VRGPVDALVIHAPEPAAAAPLLAALCRAPGLRVLGETLAPGMVRPGFRTRYLLDHAFAGSDMRLDRLHAYLEPDLERDDATAHSPVTVLPSGFLWGRIDWLRAKFPTAGQIHVHGDPWRGFCAAWARRMATGDMTALALPFAQLERNMCNEAVALLVDNFSLPIRRIWGTAHGRLRRWTKLVPGLPPLIAYRAALVVWALSEAAGAGADERIDPAGDTAMKTRAETALRGLLGPKLGLDVLAPIDAPLLAAPALDASLLAARLGGIDVWRCHDELIRVLTRISGRRLGLAWPDSVLHRMQQALRGTTMRAERDLSTAVSAGPMPQPRTPTLAPDINRMMP
jgi:hypothetical protein